MRRLLSIALSTSLLLAPVSALAVFTQPAELLTVMQAQEQAQSFSSNVKGHMHDTYFAVWMNGTSQWWNTPLHAKLKSKMTIDVARGPFKLRTKLQVLITTGRLFVMVESIKGTLVDDMISFTGDVKQKKWIEVPLNADMIQLWNEVTSLTPQNTELLAEALQMTHTRKGPGHVYTLSLTPETADEFKTTVSSLFSGFGMADLPSALVEFTTTAQTTSKDLFTNSFTKIHVLSGDFELSATSNQNHLSSMTAIAIPTNLVTADQLEAYMNTLETMVPFSDFTADILPTQDTWDTPPTTEDAIEEEILPIDDNTMDMPVEEEEGIDATFDTVEPQLGADCTDPTLDPLKLVELQRLGQCPISRPSRR